MGYGSKKANAALKRAQRKIPKTPKLKKPKKARKK